MRRLALWIASAGSVYAAQRYVARLREQIFRFDLASERGTARDDIAPGLRVIGFERRSTVIVKVTQTHVTILRVFHGGQDWEGTLLAGPIRDDDA